MADEFTKATPDLVAIFGNQITTANTITQQSQALNALLRNSGAFADQATGRVYLRVKSGVPEWVDGEALQQALADPDTRAGLTAVVPSALKRTIAATGVPEYLAASQGTDKTATLGRWAGLGAT